MRRSVQELFEEYQNNLYAAAFNVCKNAEDAKDVVQDTFIQYYSFKKEFDSELDLCQYFGQKKLKAYAAFFNSSSSFC